MTTDKNKKEFIKEAKTKVFIASITERVGSNKDGSPKFNFNKGQEIELTSSEAKALKKYIQ